MDAIMLVLTSIDGRLGEDKKARNTRTKGDNRGIATYAKEYSEDENIDYLGNNISGDDVLEDEITTDSILGDDIPRDDTSGEDILGDLWNGVFQGRCHRIFGR